MVRRNITLPKEDSFFLLGARGTGKSTLLESASFLDEAFKIDLLDQDSEEEYSLRPQLLAERCEALRKGSWISIDEIQKIPQLLDVVHALIEKKKLRFALTGSSSRKLKRKGANLLAGRALLYSLYPFTHLELGSEFSIDFALRWGGLPKVYAFNSDQLRAKFLKTYVQVYLKEEIVAEQLVRNLVPFRNFLPIAAQMNAQPLNFSNIARDTAVDPKTVQTYFQILTETYMGRYLESYSKSIRRVQVQHPKFYFFDMGVKRALQRLSSIPLSPQTSEYGEAFETWFINECFALNSYQELDYEFSYLRTKDDAEIDLIVTRPDGSQALVEIKSATKIEARHLRHMLAFKKDFPKAQYICAAMVKQAQKIEGVHVLPWKLAFKEIGFS
jgi:predicted AAA+ superfamily ATPase